MRDSIIFYRSFYEAIKDLKGDIQGEIYTAIMEYGLYGKETESLGPIARSIFMLMKPQIDANNKRHDSGCKGGRPNRSENQTETKPKPNRNQTITKPKPNNNQTETKGKPNENENIYNPPIISHFNEVGIQNWGANIVNTPDFETLCMTLGISREKTSALIQEYCSDQLGAGNDRNEAKEYRRHFFHWAKKKLSDEKQSTEPEPIYYRPL